MSEHTQAPNDADKELSDAVARFRATLPGWWFTVGRCGLTCHASVGPDRFFIDQPWLNKYDNGFHADIANPTTCATALDAAVSKAVTDLTRDDYFAANVPSTAQQAKEES